MKRTRRGRILSGSSLTALIAVPLLSLVPTAEARITSLTLTADTPAAIAAGSYGTVGAYEQLDGVATGELDPHDPQNAVIQDLDLAPRNARGNVEYSMVVSILKPVDQSKGNHTLLYDVVNRGNKVVTGWNIGGGAATPGDGFLESQGYTLVWSGWEGDLVPAAGKITLTVPIAHNRDGSSITGRVTSEFDVNAPTTAAQGLESGPFGTGLAYPAVSTDNAGTVLTRRVHQDDAREVVPNSQWAFSNCTTPDPTLICLQDGFSPNYIYELTYTAKDPRVLGIGFAATRDLVSFLRYGAGGNEGRHGDNHEKDGHAPAVVNPLGGDIRHALMHGTSQSGRMARTFLDLGFNEDQQHRRVFDGMNPHIASIRIEMNTRFAQPIRGPGLQHEEKVTTADADAPFTWGDSFDPLTHTFGGLLDRCRRSDTCPKITHTMTDTEYWQGGMSLVTTDALGKRDLAIPDNVRIYHFASTQHGGFNPLLPIPKAATGTCQLVANVNPYVYQQRALLVALQNWVALDREPPASRYGKIADHTLKPPAQVGFPDLSGLGLTGPFAFTGLYNTRSPLDWGRHFDADDESGVRTASPEVESGQYRILQPAVDADGNDIAGVRSTTLQAPLGTYTGWNFRASGFGAGDLCDLTGSYIPFAGTQAQRMANHDPRLSLHERYGNTAGYVNAVKSAANNLVSQGLLLPDDATNIITVAGNVAIP